MKLQLDPSKAIAYKSWPQKIRVMSEEWLESEAYCPACGGAKLDRLANNQPAADFRCAGCDEQFELKSTSGTFGAKVVDGAYHKMMQRLSGDDNPSLVLLSYDRPSLSVRTLEVIPRHFFTCQMIEPRTPLSSSARRAGWVGCNINLSQVVPAGRFSIIGPEGAVLKSRVLDQWKATLFLRSVTSADMRGWLLDVMHIVDQVESDNFTLSNVYDHTCELAAKYPGNKNVQPKIRQQLQLLRDHGYIRFLGRGTYKKVRRDPQ